MKITLNIDDNKIERIANAFDVTTAVEFKQKLKKMIQERVISYEVDKTIRDAQTEANNVSFDVEETIT